MTDAIEHSENKLRLARHVLFVVVLFIITSASIVLMKFTMRIAVDHGRIAPAAYITSYSGKLVAAPDYLGMDVSLQVLFFWAMLLTAVAGIVAALAWGAREKCARVQHWALEPAAGLILSLVPAVLAFSSGVDVLQLFV